MGVVDNFLFIYENDIQFMPKAIDSITPVFIENNNDLDCDRKWYTKLYRIFKFYDNILRFFVCGEEAKYLEGVSDEEITSTVTKLLKKLFKDENIPEPKQILRSKWFLNPYIRGSYSYIPFNSTTNCIKTLAEPIYINGSVSTVKKRQ